MTVLGRWDLSEEQKKQYMDAMTDVLADLRVMAGASQSELCNLVGISRQTLSAIECDRKEMSWATYAALCFFFDSNVMTRERFRKMDAYPGKLIEQINGGRSVDNILYGDSGSQMFDILRVLDDQALHTLRTMILVEYARCKGLSGDTVLKAYEGVDFTRRGPDADVEAAMQRIRDGEIEEGVQWVKSKRRRGGSGKNTR